MPRLAALKSMGHAKQPAAPLLRLSTHAVGIATRGNFPRCTAAQTLLAKKTASTERIYGREDERDRHHLTTRP